MFVSATLPNYNSYIQPPHLTNYMLRSYAFGCPIQPIINLQPYLANMLPFPQLNTINYRRILNRPVYTVNAVYPRVTPTYYQNSLSFISQRKIWSIPFVALPLPITQLKFKSNENFQPPPEKKIQNRTYSTSMPAATQRYIPSFGTMISSISDPIKENMPVLDEEVASSSSYDSHQHLHQLDPASEQSKNDIEDATNTIENDTDYDKEDDKSIIMSNKEGVVEALKNKLIKDIAKNKEKNNDKVIKELREHINKHGKSSYLNSFLIEACKSNNYKLAKIFLKDFKMSAAYKTMNGITALHYACDNKNNTLVEKLVENYQADILAPVWGSGDTPLHIASAHSNKAIIKSLTDSLIKSRNHSRIDVKNSEGKTPLMIAAQNGHSNIVKYLLESGADFYLKDNNGNTAYNLAKNYDFFTRWKFKKHISNL